MTPELDQEGPDYARQIGEAARHAIPLTLRWSGVLIVGIALVNEVIPPATASLFFALIVTFGSTLYLLGGWLARPTVPGTTSAWIYTVVMVLFVAMILAMYANRHAPWDFVYVGALITGFAPLTFGWIRYLTGGSLMIAGVILTLAGTDTPHMLDWIVGVLAALMVGGMLLHLRLQTICALAATEFAREQLVQSDALSGLLNRRGLQSRLETVWAGAMRRGEAVNVAFIDIVGLKSANDTYGHGLGDIIICEVARSIRDCVRGEDLVARWGGDEFVVVAKGDVASPSVLQARIMAALRQREAAFDGRWRGDVTVGAASGHPDQFGFTELLQLADQHMYAQRRNRQT